MARGDEALQQQTRLIIASGLFHPLWYASVARCDPDPTAAAAHYLRHASARNRSPHPLFDHDHFLGLYSKQVGTRNPLLAYLTDPKLRRASTHPLFDTRKYAENHPQARKHRYGVLGHYVAIGAPAGLAPNSWYAPDPRSEPNGLTDWVLARRLEWMARQEIASSPWTSEPVGRIDTVTAEESGPGLPDGHSGLPGISVIVPAGPATSLLESTLESVLSQTLSPLEVLVVHSRRATVAVEDVVHGVGDRRVKLIAVDTSSQAEALSAGSDAARGPWLAFCLPTAPWRPGHLQSVLAVADKSHADAAYDVVERQDADGNATWASTATTIEQSAVQSHVFLGALLVRQEMLRRLGGIDTTIHSAVGYDLELRIIADGPLPLSRYVGVTDVVERHRVAAAATPLRERPNIDIDALPTWHHVARGKHLARWGNLRPSGRADLVSIIVPTYADSVMTVRAVDRIYSAHSIAKTNHEHWDLEVLVLDNGCAAADATILASLPYRYPNLRVLHQPTNYGFALGNNIAAAQARGAILVFLNNDTEVQPGWLEPLVEALDDPSIHGAQSLLVYPSGSIQSAGIAFPSCGGIPHALLSGFPQEDASGLEAAHLSAATAASLAMRREDVVALRGFDPLFHNGMEDVDLGLRMCALRPGHFTVRPDSIVIHHESRSQGRFKDSLTNRRVLLSRYGDRMPADDEDLWRHCGFDVLSHEVRNKVSEDRRIAVPEPVLRRRSAATHVNERPPRLRWALKNPAPAGPEAELWGDTHFIRQLAKALRRLGQEVVVDYRAEFERATGSHDDVVLVIRGVAPYQPIYGQISMAWLISHPEMMSRREAGAYDLVFAASETWSRKMSHEWEVRIEPLLQATDPELFNPDRGKPDTGHPVLFVGGSRKRLRRMVGDAIAGGLPLSIYGNQWENLVSDEYIKATYLPNSEVGEAYRRAGIVLNDHWDDMREEGFISNRLFDAAASGARVISDPVVGLGDLFGRSVQIANDADDLVRLSSTSDLDGIFGDDDERRAVARRIHAEHSFDSRARSLLDATADMYSRLFDRGASGRHSR